MIDATTTLDEARDKLQDTLLLLVKSHSKKAIEDKADEAFEGPHNRSNVLGDIPNPPENDLIHKISDNPRKLFDNTIHDKYSLMGAIAAGIGGILAVTSKGTSLVVSSAVSPF